MFGLSHTFQRAGVFTGTDSTNEHYQYLQLTGTGNPDTALGAGLHLSRCRQRSSLWKPPFSLPDSSSSVPRLGAGEGFSLPARPLRGEVSSQSRHWTSEAMLPGSRFLRGSVGRLLVCFGVNRTLGVPMSALHPDQSRSVFGHPHCCTDFSLEKCVLNFSD